MRRQHWRHRTCQTLSKRPSSRYSNTLSWGQGAASKSSTLLTSPLLLTMLSLHSQRLLHGEHIVGCVLVCNACLVHCRGSNVKSGTNQSPDSSTSKDGKTNTSVAVSHSSGTSKDKHQQLYKSHSHSPSHGTGVRRCGSPHSRSTKPSVREAGPHHSRTRSGPLSPAHSCLLYTSPSPRDATLSRMPSSA